MGRLDVVPRSPVGSINGQEASPTVATFAHAAVNTIRTANFHAPTLGVPAILTPVNSPFYWPGLEIQRL
ncbi:MULTISPECIES: hypothetical protein [unclassified Gluconobacter]|uniref:hypothetical protein n=1 Tax=unclassified Gluconobacter TaxID=2644261 RepID=UPI001C05DD15|nr:MULTISPECIES: hypothetical protein [unclassified Gluconobacter]